MWPTRGVMKRLHEKYAADDEIAILYALSLLGTARPGENNLRASRCRLLRSPKTFSSATRNTRALAHFIIHSFDDPDHAILALPAARAYSKSRRPPPTRFTCHRTSSSSWACGTTWLPRTSSPTRPRSILQN